MRSEGGKTESMTSLKALSIIVGISLYRRLQQHSISGLVFISINFTYKSSSTIKSSPNISKVFSTRKGSTCLYTLSMQIQLISTILSLIYLHLLSLSLSLSLLSLSLSLCASMASTILFKTWT